MDYGIAFTKLRALKFPKKQKSQGDIAKAAKISQTYLSQIETGNKIPSTEVVKRLCKVYKTPEIALVWLGTQKKDVPKEKHKIFEELSPVMDSLVSKIITNKFK